MVEENQKKSNCVPDNNNNYSNLLILVENRCLGNFKKHPIWKELSVGFISSGCVLMIEYTLLSRGKAWKQLKLKKID